MSERLRAAIDDLIDAETDYWLYNEEFTKGYPRYDRAVAWRDEAKAEIDDFIAKHEALVAAVVALQDNPFMALPYKHGHTIIHVNITYLRAIFEAMDALREKNE